MSRELTLRIRKRSPVTCNAKQTNVPCVYKKGAGCLLRHSNCEGKPCTEGAHEPITCTAVVASLAKPARVCIDVVSAKDAMVRIFHEDSRSESSYGPAPGDRVRLCANDAADRPWRVDDLGDLDWTKDVCFTVDANARTAKAGCEPFDGVVIEGRL